MTLSQPHKRSTEACPQEEMTLRARLRPLAARLRRSAAFRFFKRVASRLDHVAVELVATSSMLSALYCILVSRRFQRECKAVTYGRREYLRHRRDPMPGDAQLRRNIHRLEKGLLASERRSVFATDYIGETVEVLGRVVANSNRGSGLDEAEVQWAFDVCDQYFETVDEDPIARLAREKYLQIPRPARVSSRPFAPYKASQRADVPPNAFETLHALAQRRKSVRHFELTPVPRKIIDKAIEVASSSPSACNRQPICFRIFDDRRLVRRVAGIPMGTAGFFENIPVFIVIVGSLASFEAERDRHVIYVDGGLAAMNLVLALEAQGLATCCINWPDIEDRERAMARALNLRPHERPIMCLATGYAHPEARVAFSAKKPLDRLRIYNQ